MKAASLFCVSSFARRLRGSIGARIIALFLGMLLLVQLASFAALRASFAGHAHSLVSDKLLAGGRLLQTLLDRQAQTLADAERLLAADDEFRTATRSGDAVALRAVLTRHRARIGASEAALLGSAFELHASVVPDDTELAALAQQLGKHADSRSSSSEIAMLHGRPHQLVLMPTRLPQSTGWLVMGYALNARLTQDLQNLAALNLTLLSRDGASGRWTVDLSSLPPGQSRALAAMDWNTAALPSLVNLNGSELGLRPMFLEPASGSVLALVSLPVDDAVRLPEDLQIALLLITLLGLGTFGLGGIFTATRVATPLRKLALAARRLGAGDYATPIGEMRRDDEIGHLAHAFERMRVSVADKQRQILKLAYWDPLTGLPNRVQFREAVREAVAAAQAGVTEGAAAVSVIMLDLDRFRQVNEVLGYRFGDLVLTRVAERLTGQSVRDGDIVARLGGDTFAVLLRHGDIDAARSVAQRIERTFDTPLTLEEHTVDMGAGIGVACWPRHASDAEALLSHAEVAMYAAKRRTTGPLTYHPSIDVSSAQTLSLLSELRQAVLEGQLRLYLQPKLALDTAAIIGAEALVRWEHPRRGLLPPAEFIPFAEQTGFIRTLTLWVFEEAACHWHRLHAQGMRLTLSVNLSARDLLDSELASKFDAIMLKHHVPAEAFCLEITESAIMEDAPRAQATLDALSALGFKLSIDDFGTGYSSLAYLKRLPVDELKIDKSFVLSMQSDADDAQIVRSTIDMAHNLGLRVVAEGVENAAVWRLLRELQCDHAQGYHMGRPMEAAEFAKWSAAWVAQRTPNGVETHAMLH